MRKCFNAEASIVLKTKTKPKGAHKMSQKDRYDDAHKKEMDKINEDVELSDIPEKFVKGVFGFPRKIAEELTKTDIDEKAERDALDGKYDPPEEKSGCFISTACASAVDLPDDCHELITLRTFRDSYLLSSEEGRQAIARYYTIAPPIVTQINRSSCRATIYRSIYTMLVRPAVELIEMGLPAQAFKLYQNSVLELAETFNAKNTK